MPNSWLDHPVNDRIRVLRAKMDCGRITDAERAELFGSYEAHGLGQTPMFLPAGAGVYTTDQLRELANSQLRPAVPPRPSTFVDEPTHTRTFVDGQQILLSKPGRANEPPITGREGMNNSHVPCIDDSGRPKGQWK